MNMLTRREVAAGLGGIVVAFTLLPRLDIPALAQQAAPLPGSLPQNRDAGRLDPRPCRRHRDGVHRQGRARPGRDDRARPDRGGGARAAAARAFT